MFRASAQVFGGRAGLLRLGAAELGQVLPPVFAYWRGLGSRYVAALCTRPDVEGRRAAVPAPSEEDLAVLASAAPMMPGAEYLTVEVLGAPWGQSEGLHRYEQGKTRSIHCGRSSGQGLPNSLGGHGLQTGGDPRPLPGACGALRQLPRWARTSTR